MAVAAKTRTFFFFRTHPSSLCKGAVCGQLTADASDEQGRYDCACAMCYVKMCTGETAMKKATAISISLCLSILANTQHDRATRIDREHTPGSGPTPEPPGKALALGKRRRGGGGSRTRTLGLWTLRRAPRGRNPFKLRFEIDVLCIGD